MHNKLAALSLVLALWLSACSTLDAMSSLGGLTVEESALQMPPGIEPRIFAPKLGSMQAVLARHAQERELTIPDNSLLVDGRYSMRASLGGDELIATENYSADGSFGWVTVERNGQEIYRIDTGMASPLTALQGLWVYDDHWMLESALVTTETACGQISRDGELLNTRLGYSDAFDSQVLHGRPFYFFMQDGKIGYSYDGRDFPGLYDEIPHYQCCSASARNPIKAENMVAFFARRAETWYYIEAGVFK